MYYEEKRLYIIIMPNKSRYKYKISFHIRKQLSSSNVNTKYIWNNQRSFNNYKYS